MSNGLLPSSYQIENPVHVTLKNIIYTSQNRGYIQRVFTPWKEYPTRILLDNISLVAYPGELLMILGPSGSGKTTLLNVIGLRLSGTDKLMGELRYNGEPKTLRDIRSFLNYVMERDVLLDHLTLFETFETYVELKLPGMSKPEQLERIESILTSMSLQHCRSTIIGEKGKGGLSTSEMKRVSIGLELLDSPSVLICDEPTSGLDCNLSIKLVNCLLQQARKGTTVIMTVHQPCSQVFNMCDRFLLLSKGRIAYCGTPTESKNHLKKIGIVTQQDWEISDIFIFLLALLDQPNFSQRAVNRSLSDFPFFLEQKILHGSSLKSAEDLFHFWDTSNEKKRIDRTIEEINSRHLSQSLHFNAWPTTLLYEFKRIFTLQKRTFRNSIRNFVTCCTILLIHVIQALIFGSIFHNLAHFTQENHPSPLIESDLWNKSPWLREFASVSSQQPFTIGFTPLLNVYQQGIDGNGSFVFFSTSSSFDQIKYRIHYSLDYVVTCLYNKYGLRDRNYPPLKMMESPPAPNWNSWLPERIHMNLAALYQILDYRLDDKPWKKPLNIHKFFSSDCEDITCMNRVAYESFKEIIECTGLPPIPGNNTFLTTLSNSSTTNNQFKIFNTISLQHKIRKRKALNDASKRQCIRKLKEFQQTRLTSGELERTLWDFIGINFQILIDTVYLWLCRLVTCEEPICNTLSNALTSMNIWKDGLYASSYSAFNLSGCLFLIVTLVGFSSFQAILTFPQERESFNRETANGLYSSLSYYIAKNITDIPFFLIPSLLTATIFFFFTDSSVTLPQFSIYCLVIALTSFAAYGFGYIIAAASPRVEVAVLIGPLSLGLLVLLTGFFIRDRDLPSVFAWLKNFSFYRWAYYSLIINQFASGKFHGYLPNEIIQSIMGVSTPSLLRSIFSLFFVGIFYRFLAFFFLCYVNRHVGLAS